MFSTKAPLQAKAPVKVSVTGAAGAIGYALVFRIASGAMLGADQPVILQLLEVPNAQNALKGVIMELQDCAFPTLHSVTAHEDPNTAFADLDFGLLVGARPRGPGMERKDLLLANAQIFSAQGKALNNVAKKTVRILVVGNPANTNALITSHFAKDIPKENITAMTRLDHNRAISSLALKTGVHVTDIEKVTIWGNHSATQYPDIHFATVQGAPALSKVDQPWFENTLIPEVQQRGAAIIKARGSSSAASAANAAIEHIRDWTLGSNGKWVSMGIPSDGSYGIEPGLVYSYPVICKNGKYERVKGLTLNEFSKKKLELTARELREERDGVKSILV